MENKKKEVRDGEDDEVEEEMKMEKFYSLLRSFRDARDRRRRELLESDNNERNRKKMKGDTTTNAKAEVSFEWQDFTTETHFRQPPLVFPNPIPCDAIKDNKGSKKKKEQQHDLALDLKLTL
ncbi:protein NIM1-INTERACTING 1-like [Abrus precatorius]|uniref:Protein NIM1-INTERACTING 1-like n=1 Tax=Abrus precatorius TaxID=3816 RepID=A0A8B8MIS0_ABRPR|nr:protein NIM1-INTERACTING 1-like [Abrus precatorius]